MLIYEEGTNFSFFVLYRQKNYQTRNLYIVYENYYSFLIIYIYFALVLGFQVVSFLTQKCGIPSTSFQFAIEY